MPKPMTDAEYATHFWSRVDRRSESECWEWSGFRDRKGYGRLKRNGDYYLAHRFAMLCEGVQIDGLLVCHRCDNPPCCNPAHLFVGTVADNSRDMVLKGRNYAPVGEQSATSKLTAGQVVAIRADPRGAVVVARDYGVTPSTILRVRNEPWGGIPPVPMRRIHARAKLNDDAVRLIRSTDLPAKVLADRFGVAETTVLRLRQGIGWRHVA